MVMMAKEERGKRRSDAWENQAGLSHADQHKIYEWARVMGYAKAINLAVAEFKIEAPSMSSFCAWYEYMSQADTEERIHKAIVDGKAVRDLVEKSGAAADITADLEMAAKAALLTGEPDAIKLLVNLALKARKQEAVERETELAIEKYRDSMKSAIEKGLDALALQAKGNDVALRHYGAFREAVMKSVDQAK